jgi:hypothetical protein
MAKAKNKKIDCLYEMTKLLPFIVDRYERDDRFQGYWDKKTAHKITAGEIVKNAIIEKTKKEKK